MSETVHINGEEKAFAQETVEALLRAENVDPQARFVAVAVNGAVVPRGRWTDQLIKAGDDIEIVRPAPGG